MSLPDKPQGMNGSTDAFWRFLEHIETELRTGQDELHAELQHQDRRIDWLFLAGAVGIGSLLLASVGIIAAILGTR